MDHSNPSLKPPRRAVPTSLIILALLIALAGFADATYLTIEHYQNAIPPCTIGSCEAVLSSAYSTVAGVPVALAGAIYYLLIAVGLFGYLESKKEHMLQLALYLPVVGFIASLVLIFLMAFVIHAYCIYCLGSATSTTLLFIISAIIFVKYRRPDTLAQ